jgi:hypothetical protein
MRSKWLDWKPGACVIENPLNPEPSKPSKPSFVGFVGSPSGGNPIIRPVDPLDSPLVRGILVDAPAVLRRLILWDEYRHPPLGPSQKPMFEEGL